MNIEKEVISAVRDRVTRPLDVSVDDAVGDSVWFYVSDSLWYSVRESVWASVSNAIDNNISEYEY